MGFQLPTSTGGFLTSTALLWCSMLFLCASKFNLTGSIAETQRLLDPWSPPWAWHGIKGVQILGHPAPNMLVAKKQRFFVLKRQMSQCSAPDHIVFFFRAFFFPSRLILSISVVMVNAWRPTKTTTEGPRCRNVGPTWCQVLAESHAAIASGGRVLESFPTNLRAQRASRMLVKCLELSASWRPNYCY